ncbi:hypothetical protein chiPu_0024849, partial [Chiloscyllium punctatum]|nr:hypothetical protein [Chiloscyllium punctatum]
DMQTQMEEDSRQHEELREQYGLVERRCGVLSTELEETRGALDLTDRARKILEQELMEMTDKYNEVNTQVREPGPMEAPGGLQSPSFS